MKGIAVYNKNGEVFRLDTAGEVENRYYGYNKKERATKAIGLNAWNLIEKYGSFFIPSKIGGENIEIKPDMSITDIDNRFKLLSSSESIDEKDRNDEHDRIRFIVMSMASTRTSFAKQICDSILEFLESDSRGYSLTKNTLDLASSMSSDYFDTVKKRIDMFESKATMESLGETSPYGERYPYPYKDILNLFKLIKKLNGTLHGFADLTMISRLIDYVEEIDFEFDSRSLEWTDLSENIGAIRSLPNNRIEKILRIISRKIYGNREEDYDINPTGQRGSQLILLELYRRGMNRSKYMVFLSERSKEAIVTTMLKEDMSRFLVAYDKEFKKVFSEVYTNLTENKFKNITNSVREYTSKRENEGHGFLEMMAGTEQHYKELEIVLPNSSDEYKRLIVKNLIEPRWSAYEEFGRVTNFLPDNETKTIRGNSDNYESVYFNFGILLKMFADIESTYGEALIDEIVLRYFGALSRAKGSEKKISYRMLSLFIYSSKSVVAEGPETNKKILSVLEHLSSSGVKDSTVEGILKGPKELYEGMSAAWYASRTSADQMFKKDYGDIYEIIKDSQRIRDSVKTTLLLKSLS